MIELTMQDLQNLFNICENTQASAAQWRNVINPLQNKIGLMIQELQQRAAEPNKPGS